MSTERNKAIARQFQTTFNERDWAGCRSLLAPDCRSYQPGAAGSLTNDELTAVGQLFASAFPDLVVNVHDPVAEDNRVVTRISFAGTQRNDCQGIPATGKRIVLEGYIMDQIVDGAIIEHRAMFDAMTLLQQLGVAPDPEAAELIGASQFVQVPVAGAPRWASRALVLARKHCGCRPWHCYSRAGPHGAAGGGRHGTAAADECMGCWRELRAICGTLEPTSGGGVCGMAGGASWAGLVRSCLRHGRADATWARSCPATLGRRLRSVGQLPRLRAGVCHGSPGALRGC